MSLQEAVLMIDCAGEQLVGVLARPSQAPPQALGVLFVVGGPQVRSGSHRMFTILARELAVAGQATLRFDVRGMGDSSGAQRSFEDLSDDIGCAVDALLAAEPALQGVVLWGLCDGASAALLYLDERRDARVKGLCLANPWVRSAVTQARAQVRHYYRDRLRQPAFWMKLLRGGVSLSAWRDYLRARRLGKAAADAPAQGFQQRMARAWRSTVAQKLLLLSGNDYTAREFEDYVALHGEWAGLLDEARRVDLPGADHSFSDPRHLQQAAEASLQSLREWQDSLKEPQPC